jgi:WD40 repeat protein
MGFDSRGSVIAVAGPGAVGAWDIDGGQRLGRRFRWGAVASDCPLYPCTVIASHGTLMATTQSGGTVAEVDLRNGRLLHTYPARNGSLAPGVAFTADDRRLVTAGTAGTVTIWDVATHARVRVLRFPAPVFATAISPSGRLVAVIRQATGARDAQVEVRALPSGATVFTHTIRGGAGNLQFSRDGRALFASGCCRGGSTVASWDAQTGAVEFVRTQETQLTAFALMPDARALLVGDENGAVALWDARTGKQLGAATTVATEGIAQIAVEPNGRIFAVAAYGGSAALWDVGSRSRVGDAFPVSAGAVPAVAFEPSGRLLITERGSATDWPLDRTTLQRFACGVAGRDLTRDEWNNLLPSRPYRRVCPDG